VGPGLGVGFVGPGPGLGLGVGFVGPVPGLGLGVVGALPPSTLALLASFDSLLCLAYILMAALVASSAAA
jgi:hypothetical protein